MGALTQYQHGASLFAAVADWADNRDDDDEMGTIYTLSKGIVLVPGSMDPEPPARRLTRRVRVKPARVFHPADPTLTPEALPGADGDGHVAAPAFRQPLQ